MLKPEHRSELIESALEASKRAYVPYSHFHVGASVLDDQGRIFSGCNIENSSYGATNCAERTAIFKAVSEGAKQIKALAVITDANEYARPCGICRQVLSEFAAEDFVLIALAPDKSYRELTMDELLPGAFGVQSLRSSTAIQGEDSSSE